MCRKVAGTEQAAKVTFAMAGSKQDAQIKLYVICNKQRLVFTSLFIFAAGYKKIIIENLKK